MTIFLAFVVWLVSACAIWGFFYVASERRDEE